MPIRTLRDSLAYEPHELRFGTSGRRGEVIHLTQLEVYINVLGELRYLQSLPVEKGGILPGDEFYFAFDLRPSSPVLSQAVERAVRDAGLMPVNLGPIPTPALTCYALARRKGSLMVTGSHIPFDHNGYKLNTSIGELMKTDEEPIGSAVRDVRQLIYSEPDAESLFNDRGGFKTNAGELATEYPGVGAAYVDRYTNFFAGSSLAGLRIVVYQHSAVGRDLLVDLLTRFGAEAIPMGRSETFVPIDTENIDAGQLAAIQELTREAAAHGPVHAVVSVDGDSDRPLVLGVDGSGQVRFFPGDLVGMIAAEYLGADAVVVPVSCNDAIDRGNLAGITEPKTRIGSPYVIEGMNQAVLRGRRRVCGWEANGGFLLGSDIERNGRTLTRLATRDAFLPISCVLFAAHEQGLPLAGLFDRLPRRFSRSGLLARFPRSVSLKILEELHHRPERFFPAETGLGSVTGLDDTDGVRIRFGSGEIVHIRPSGNADELRIYAVADSRQRADEIVSRGLAEPAGLLRQMEKAVTQYIA